MPYAVLGSDLSLTTTMQQVLAVTFGASQLGEVDTSLTVALPAGHGGLQLNWKLPAAWPFYGFTARWTFARVDTLDPDAIVDSQPVATPSNNDWAVVFPPSAAAATYRVKAIHAFKAPAGGGTLSLMAGMVAAGSAVVINSNATQHLATYAWYELQ